MQRIALASSRTLCNDVKWLTAARQLSSDAATGSITPAQPSNRAEPDGNWVREMLGVQESYVGQNAKNPAWINSTTGAVIGGECETPSMERFRRVNQSLPRLKGQVNPTASAHHDGPESFNDVLACPFRDVCPEAGRPTRRPTAMI